MKWSWGPNPHQIPSEHAKLARAKNGCFLMRLVPPSGPSGPRVPRAPSLSDGVLRPGTAAPCERLAHQINMVVCRGTQGGETTHICETQRLRSVYIQIRHFVPLLCTGLLWPRQMSPYLPMGQLALCHF